MTGSNGPKRHSSRRYRTLNSKSEVDENLFGQPNRIKQAQELRDARSSDFFSNLWDFFSDVKFVSKEDSTNDMSNKQPQDKGTKKGPNNKEYVKHITKDLIRDIL
jgi:hypothetical protein